MDGEKSSFELGREPKRNVRPRKLHELPKDSRIQIRNTSDIRDVHYNPKEFRNHRQIETDCTKPLTGRRGTVNDTSWATLLIGTILVVSIAFVLRKAGI